LIFSSLNKLINPNFYDLEIYFIANKKEILQAQIYLATNIN